MLSLEIAILSEPGGRQYNEDACGHWNSEQRLYCVLADGAGGHGGGDIASRLAVRDMLQSFAASEPATGRELLAQIRATNRALLSERTPGTERENMHSTVVCLALDFIAGRADWAHAGDSRCYHFRAGRLIERTLDHSHVQSLVDAGLLAPEEMQFHPKRSVLRSALGVGDADLEVGCSDRSREVLPGDVFLLCTDGLWEHVPQPQLEELLQSAAGPQQWLAALEAQIEVATRGHASRDNFRAITVWAAAAD